MGNVVHDYHLGGICAVLLNPRLWDCIDHWPWVGVHIGVVTDGTIFGLLLTKGARRLGDISYGIYLLQGPVLFVVFWPAAVRADALSSPWLHWIIVMIAALLLVALATATHVLIEIPGVQAGRWFTSRIMNIRSLRQA